MNKFSDRFSTFIGTERELYDDQDHNRVAFSMAQVARYVQFVEVARGRYQVVSDENIRRMKKMMDDIGRSSLGSRPATPEEIQELTRDADLQMLLHYEIECYLTFAALLLAKVAQCIGDFFGSVPGTSLQSHHDWCKNREKYSAAKELVIPEGMFSLMEQLQSVVVAYRDKQITHFKNPRALHATTCSFDGGSQIAITSLYPRESDVQHSSPKVEEVDGLLATYVDQFVTLVETNRAKSRYKLRST